jgi:hypothetical protein
VTDVLPSHGPAATLALAFASELFEQLDLDLLNFEKPIVLTPQKMIEFFVKVPDFQLGFQVDFVIVFAAQSIIAGNRAHIFALHQKSVNGRQGLRGSLSSGAWQTLNLVA